MLPRIATLVAAEGESLDAPHLARNLSDACAALGVPLGGWRWIEPGRVADVPVQGEIPSHHILTAMVQGLQGARVDIAVQQEPLRRKRLLLSDMDSTMIGQECIDELADVAGVGAQVAEITERAMAGEMNFEEALTARLALLRGLPESVLEQVWNERIRPTPGAATLVATMRKFGAHCVLVSGGFTFFTARLRERLGMEADFSNILGVANGVLTGEAIAPILGKDAKLQILRAQAHTLGLGMSETMAVGDGANDAPMLDAAGLGVAYHAKAAAEAVTNGWVRSGDLTALLSFQGIPRAEWIIRE